MSRVLHIPARGAWLVGARLRAEGHREAVPSVDGDDDHRQLDSLLLGEPGTNFLECAVRHPRAADIRHDLGPRKCRALPLREEWRLAPYGNRVQALLRLAEDTGVLRMHVHAVGA